MPNIPGLRSIYHKTGRLVYFGRMLDKIRLHANEALPAEYQKNMGGGFDERCCDFLRIDHSAVQKRTLEGGTDEEILAWCHEQGTDRTDEECEIWNGFMMKRGWRDPLTELLQLRIKESGFEDKPIETMFDYIEFDEGRDPVANRSWNQ